MEICHIGLYSAYDCRYCAGLSEKYLLGGIITALFIALQIQSNHIQMSYYFMFVILFFVGAYFEDAYKKKELPHFSKRVLF